MKKTIILSFATFLLSIVTVAQNTEPYMNVIYNPDGVVLEEEHSLKQAVVTILDGIVSLEYSTNAFRNKQYDFDDMVELTIFSKPVTQISSVDENTDFVVYVDQESQLHIQSSRILGKITLYSASGTILLDMTSANNQEVISLSDIPKGVYIVRSEFATAKFIN